MELAIEATMIPLKDLLVPIEAKTTTEEGVKAEEDPIKYITNNNFMQINAVRTLKNKI